MKRSIWIGITEEAVLNLDYDGYIGGRIEAYHSGEEYPDEYRFLTKHVHCFNWIRNHWEGRFVNRVELAIFLWCIRAWFFSTANVNKTVNKRALFPGETVRQRQSAK